MSYRIITDNCCDFPAEMYEELNLSVVPLVVRFQGKEVSQGITHMSTTWTKVGESTPMSSTDKFAFNTAYEVAIKVKLDNPSVWTTIQKYLVNGNGQVR